MNIIVLDVAYENLKRNNCGQGAIERTNWKLSDEKNVIRPQFHGVGNQIIFDKGIQHVEVMLAILDSNKMYTSQIWRHDGLSYADQVNPAIDRLIKHLELTLLISKNAHGMTPGEVYQNMWEVANDPTLILSYMNYKTRLDPQFYANTNDYNGQDMFNVISDIETGEKKPEYIWQAFNERRYILSAPSLAREFQPELWRKWRNRVQFGDY